MPTEFNIVGWGVWREGATAPFGRVVAIALHNNAGWHLLVVDPRGSMSSHYVNTPGHAIFVKPFEEPKP